MIIITEIMYDDAFHVTVNYEFTDEMISRRRREIISKKKYVVKTKWTISHDDRTFCVM